MFQDKRILITGSEGFIGSHLTDALKDNCKDLYCVDKVNGEDLCNINIVNSLPDVDIIFHMAARNGTKWFYEEPFSVLQNCTTPTLNLIERYKDTKVKFIYASSCEIYADSTESGINKVPTSEDVSALAKFCEHNNIPVQLIKAVGESNKDRTKTVIGDMRLE